MVVVIAKGKVQPFNCQEKKNVAVRRKHTLAKTHSDHCHQSVSPANRRYFFVFFLLSRLPLARSCCNFLGSLGAKRQFASKATFPVVAPVLFLAQLPKGTTSHTDCKLLRPVLK